MITSLNYALCFSLGLNLSDFDAKKNAPIAREGKISKNLRKVSQGQRKFSLTNSLSRHVKVSSGTYGATRQPDLVTSDGSPRTKIQPLVAIDETQENRTNINVRAAFIHVLGDLCQSLGVVAASLIIYYKVNHHNVYFIHIATVLFDCFLPKSAVFEAVEMPCPVTQMLGHSIYCMIC